MLVEILTVVRLADGCPLILRLKYVLRVFGHMCITSKITLLRIGTSMDQSIFFVGLEFEICIMNLLLYRIYMNIKV